MFEWLKLAQQDDAGQHDPNQSSSTLSPVPSVSVQNKTAPGHKGPRGMAPRTAYTRVNTGTPPTPDAGSEHQKSIAPRGMEFLPGRAKTASQEKIMTTMMRRPQLQDLVKEAMEGAVRKVDINYEAARQLANLGEPERIKTAAPELTVTSGEYIEKLAGALDYLAKQAADDSAGVGPGAGPGSLESSAATSSGQVLEAGKGGQGKNQPPKDPPMQSSGVANDAATGMKDNMEMMHGEQPVDPMHNEKTSSVLFAKNLARLGLVKEAIAPHPRDLFANHLVDSLQRGINPDQVRELAQQGIGDEVGAASELGQHAQEHPIRHALGGGAGGAVTGGVLGLGTSLLPGLREHRGKVMAGGAALGGLIGATRGPSHIRQAAEMEAAKKALEGDALHQALQHHAQGMITDEGGTAGATPEDRKAALRYALAGAPKTASVSILNRNLARLGLAKTAEDGDGEGGAPHISAGSAPAQGAVAPPGASPSGEQVPSEPSDVNAQKALIGSNEAAINYTKQQAKRDPKHDAGLVYDEPALSSAHDNVLQQAFDATPKAGVKISSDLTRVAAAQALLRKYAEEACAKDKKGKEKLSGPPNPALMTPQGQMGGQDTAAGNRV